MILRLLSIVLSVASGAAIWWGYENITLLRGSPFWDYRYIGLALAAILGLSAMQSLMDFMRQKFDPPHE